MKPQKTKYHWLKWLLSILLIIGLAMIFNEPLKNLMVQYMSHSSYNAPLKKIDKKNGKFNFKQVKPLNTSIIAKASTADPNVIARLAIPAINLQLPVFYGLDNSNLARGVGTMKPNQVLGQGNYALAGHYMTNSGNLLFAPLKQIQKSDYIYLANSKNEYIYQVIDKKTINEHQVKIIDDIPNKRLLTLITCDSATINTTRRFVVQAKLVKKQTTKKSTEKIIMKSKTNKFHWLWLLILSVFLVIILFIVFKKINKKHSQH